MGIYLNSLVPSAKGTGTCLMQTERGVLDSETEMDGNWPPLRK